MKQNGRFCKSGMATQITFDGNSNTAMCTETDFIFQRRGKRDARNPSIINPDTNHPNGFNAREVSEDPTGTVIQISAPYECNPQDDEEFCWLAY